MTGRGTGVTEEKRNKEKVFLVAELPLIYNANMKVLVVEDDRNLLDVLKYNLRKEGYDVITAVNGVQALENARNEKPDFVILDIMLPEINGFEVCRILRKESGIPILMLTARDDEMDKVIGLDLGADDYMTKPFQIREFLARIRAILRRTDMTGQQVNKEAKILQIKDITVDLGRHIANFQDKVLNLTPKEFDLLVFLMQNKGIAFSREQLLEKVWGYDYLGGTRTIDVHIRWLREKIENDPEHPVLLLTVRGVGYKLEA